MFLIKINATHYHQDFSVGLICFWQPAVYCSMILVICPQWYVPRLTCIQIWSQNFKQLKTSQFSRHNQQVI